MIFGTSSQIMRPLLLYKETTAHYISLSHHVARLFAFHSSDHAIIFSQILSIITASLKNKRRKKEHKFLLEKCRDMNF